MAPPRQLQDAPVVEPPAGAAMPASARALPDLPDVADGGGPGRDVRRRRPPALSFLLRMDTLRRLSRIVLLLALDAVGVECVRRRAARKVSEKFVFF